MLKDDVIEALANYFEVEVPDKEEGVYDYDYDWVSGCSMGRNRPWLTLKNVVKALDYAGLLEDEED